MANVKGLTITSKQLERKFQLMQRLPKTAGIQAGFNEAAERMRGLVETEAPNGPTGNLKKGIVAGELKSDNEPGSYVASRAPHSHLVNFGTAERVQTTTGRRTGVMPANAFFDRGVRAGRLSARRIIYDAVAKEVIGVTRS